MRLLLISNSTNPGEEYLEYPKEQIKKFLGEKPVHAVFIPYAAVCFSYATYEEKVKTRFDSIGHHITSIHRYEDLQKAIENAEAIVTGGGNTWKLVQMLRSNQLLDTIREKVRSGTPYIGWSAGSNIACPSLRTTNDMPIIDPGGFDTLDLIPFQINPHYTDAHPAGHAGETREDRIKEFIEINPGMYVAGLRESTMFLLENDKLSLIGDRPVRIFKKDVEPVELDDSNDFSFLMEN